MDKDIKITFLSDWQISSGLGDGYLADSTLHRDVDGLPCIPGRALKGALREAAWRLTHCRKDLNHILKLLWGTDSIDIDSNQSGLLQVSTARLPEDLRQIFRDLPKEQRESCIGDLLFYRTQTALKEDRQVKDGSLRKIECGIAGLEFEAKLHFIDDIPDYSEDWLCQYLAAVCAALKSIGGNRSRGLGYCQVRLVGSNANMKIALPKVLEGRA